MSNYEVHQNIVGDRIVRRREVEARIGLSRSSIYAMMTAGLFPRLVRLGRRAVGSPESVIVEWLASREEATR